jgi:hypothetical protein
LSDNKPFISSICRRYIKQLVELGETIHLPVLSSYGGGVIKIP